MHYVYNTKGCCARTIEFDLKDNIVTNIKFNGGCPGNLKMLSKIMDGWTKEKIINVCKDNTCASRQTSCADQLSKALENIEIKEK